ncbi:MAG: VTT domain-containing protein [Desulfuromusa sp.]
MDWAHLWSNILQGVTLHPVVAYLAIILISLSESLAVVGLLVPGTVMMVGVGALAGSGVISLKITLIAAMAGAIVGDGVSYWLGHHYHQEINNFWPFRTHPKLLTHGEEFFHRHGGKSVFLGRFVGPVRPVIPVIAGMLDMHPRHFLIVNILSAVGWAFAYIIPGVILGSSLTLVGVVSTRLSILLLCLGGLLWLAFLLIKQGYRLLDHIAAKSKKRLLVLLCLVLIAASWVFLGVVEDLLSGDPLIQADQAVYNFLQALRSPWGDSLMVAVTELGDALSNTAVVIVVLLFLLLHKQLRTAAYWLLAVGGGIGLVQLFKWSLHRPRPIDIYHGVSSWGFPSGHTTMSVVVYGFLAILLIRSLSPRWRWLPFVFAFGVSLLVAFSRIYLGAHWLSDVLGGMALGWVWVTLLGVIYLHNTAEEPPGRSLRPIAFLAFVGLLLMGSWHIAVRHSADLERYRVQVPAQILKKAEWLEQGFQQLPAWRYTLFGEKEQPLTLQLAGSPQQLTALLLKKGWQKPATVDAKQLLNVFVSNIAITDLPLLPHLSDGRQEALLLAKTSPTSRLVLRLWPTPFHLKSGSTLWVGTVETETALALANLLTLPVGKKDFGSALAQLKGDLISVFLSSQPRHLDTDESINTDWNGELLLIDSIGSQQKL